jgi:predicted acetyltransferase
MQAIINQLDVKNEASHTTIFGNSRFFHDSETTKGFEVEIERYKIQERQTNYMRIDYLSK